MESAELTYQVENNIPIPASFRKSKWREQFAQMNVGQSFLVPSKLLPSIWQAASRYKTKIVVRPAVDSAGKPIAAQHRVWKTA